MELEVLGKDDVLPRVRSEVEKLELKLGVNLMDRLKHKKREYIELTNIRGKGYVFGTIKRFATRIRGYGITHFRMPDETVFDGNRARIVIDLYAVNLGA
jgi:hypothetical protein